MYTEIPTTELSSSLVTSGEVYGALEIIIETSVVDCKMN